MAKYAVVAGDGLGKDLGARGNQEPRIGPWFAGAHVLGEDEDFVARAFHDQVQVALDQERGGFQRGAADRHGQHARGGLCLVRACHERDLNLLLKLLVLGVVRHLVFEVLVRIDQRNIEPLDAGGQVHLAEVGFQIDRVRSNRDAFHVPRGELEPRRFIGAKDALGHNRQFLGCEPGHARQGLAGEGTPIQLAIFLECVLELSQLFLERDGDHELGARRLIRVGVFRDQPPPLADRVIPFFLLIEHVPECEQDGRIATIERVLDQEFRPEFASRVVVLGLEFLLALQELRVDNLPLDFAPGLVRWVPGQIVAPGLEGLGEFLLQLVGPAQQVASVRDFVRGLVALVGQEAVEALDRVFVPRAIDLAAGDPQVGLAGQLVTRETLEKGLERGGAERQIVVRVRSRDAKRLREVERGLGDPFAVGVGISGQQILPGAPCLGSLTETQLAFTQPIPRLDIQGASGMILGELGVAVRRLLEVSQGLVALGHADLDPGALFRLGADGQRLVVELEGLVVVGRLDFVLGLEVGLGEFQVDVGDFLLAIERQQVVGFLAIDQLGALKISLPRHGNRAAEFGTARPGAVGKITLDGLVDGNRFVVLLAEMQGSSLEEPQPIANRLDGRIVGRQCRVNRLNRPGVVAILQ